MTTLGESSRLLYGTDNLELQVQPQTLITSSKQRSRRWGYVGVALLCTGALVGKNWHDSHNTATTAIGDGPITSLNNNVQVHASVSSSEDSTYAEFYASLQASLDTSKDPCQDFYQYACGGWLETHDIPSDSASIDASFFQVAQDNKKIIEEVIDAKPPLVGPFFESCLNEQEIDDDSVTYVADLIRRIHERTSTLDLLAYAGELDQALGIQSFFQISVQADPLNPDMNVLTLEQGGLTLPSREYYLEPAKHDKYATLFLEYITAVFAKGALIQHGSGGDATFAANILETETAFATISLTNAELRDPWKTSTPYTLHEIKNQFPYLWAYLSGIDKQEAIFNVQIIIGTPTFFDKQSAILNAIETNHLKNYLSFHVIDSFKDVLGEYFRQAGHAFHGAIRGAGALPTRHQFCVDTTTSYLGTQLGEYYMLRVFDENAKASAQSLIDQVEDSMRRLLGQESWLDAATAEAAQKKLDHVRNYIGGPDSITDLPFAIENDKFFDNVLSLKQLAAKATIQSIGQPVDRARWDMFASTVNAYYDPSANKIVFPAAILQPPFYSATAFPAAANYARIGMVMGHELSHGFDDQGRNYDGKGALRKWWSPEVSQDFESRAQCLASQYSSFRALTPEGEFIGMVNGNLTLGENIADNGGIHLSYQAYQLHKKVSGISLVGKTEQEDAQVFFTAFAQQWCEKRTRAYSELLLATDPHSPGRWRVNGPVANFVQFAEAFQCPLGTPMNPINKCLIW